MDQETREASAGTMHRRGAPAPDPSLARVATVVSALLAACLVLFLAARSVAGELLSVPGVLVSVLGGALAALLIGSVGEWLVHRFLMHRRIGPRLLSLPYELHHRAHHWIQYRPDEYVHEDRVQRVPVSLGRLDRVCTTRAGRVLTVASHIAFYAFFAVILGVLPAIVLTGNPLFSAVVTVTLATAIYLFVRVHDAVHHPGLSRLERFGWFRFLDRHHYIHHVDNRANTNFLLPLCDLLMGTLRRELSARELEAWPSYEEARRNIVHPTFDESGLRRREPFPSSRSAVCIEHRDRGP